ncbi:PAS domain-containing protein [Salipiger sp. IMCC34102]|uniref:PAS domain-containing protein n=1 Tax=Salipiger sp. IMCC34102 TaxID=2510647 RepID=UPI00101DA6C7|nr:PAS domain-containing protein [Salipiger sp. IMCC34102]RYH02337.1 PAS domain-containing protein [Salipiger sp. IMCC34102]
MIDDRPDIDGAQDGDQQDWALDPHTADAAANVAPRDMALDLSQLFEQALEQTRMAITITDVTRPDNPIIFANQAFSVLTGFDTKEAVGRNCRFLQGPDTDPASIQEIRDCLASRDVRVIEILNYRKDGTPFWNGLHIGPIFDADGRVTHFYGSQWDITDTVQKRRRLELQADVAEELRHRTRNLFSVMTSILRLSARGETDVDTLVEKVTARLHALDIAHDASLSDGADGQAADLHEMVTTVLRPYQLGEDRRMRIDGELTAVPRHAVTPLGLTLHELATNALKYGALSRAGGVVTVSWTREKGVLTLHWVETGGPASRAPDDTNAGSGSRIVRGVLRSIGAEIAFDWRDAGLAVHLTVPLEQG